MRSTSNSVLDGVHEECQRPGGVIAIQLELQRKVSFALIVLREQRPWQTGPVANIVVFDNFVAVIKNKFGVQETVEQGAQRYGDQNCECAQRYLRHASY